MHMCAREQGFTLIETLIAIAVFSVGMIGSVGLTTVTLRGHIRSQHLTAATLLAHDKLESIYTTAYKDVSDAYEVITIDNLQQYIRTVEVKEDVPTPGMKIVSIAVHWVNSDIPDRQVVLRTIVVEN